VGRENIFIFGLTADEVKAKKQTGYNPREYYERNPHLRKVIDMIASGFFSPVNKELFKPIVDSLLNGDQYMLLADFQSYAECQERVSKEFQHPDLWARKCILNVASVGKFSSDRSIADYAREIWSAKPVPIALESESEIAVNE
jgi:starch phosphorylase